MLKERDFILNSYIILITSFLLGIRFSDRYHFGENGTLVVDVLSYVFLFIMIFSSNRCLKTFKKK